VKITRSGYYTITGPDGDLLTKPDGLLRQVTSRDEAYERITEDGREGRFTMHCPERYVDMYLSQASIGIALNPIETAPTILPIPNLEIFVGGTIDMSQYIVDPDNIRTSTVVNGLTTFASYDSGTELLTGDADGTETGVTLEVTF
jgi:hypothetical protein